MEQEVVSYYNLFTLCCLQFSLFCYALSFKYYYYSFEPTTLHLDHIFGPEVSKYCTVEPEVLIVNFKPKHLITRIIDGSRRALMAPEEHIQR